VARPGAVISATKICGKCGELKPSEDFYPRKDAPCGLQSMCKKCSIFRSTKWRRENPVAPDIARENNLKFRYDLTVADYDERLMLQGGVCAGCGTVDPRGSDSFCVDHDHSCCPGIKSCGGCIRGLLCHGCNAGIGNLGDDPERLRKLADYIEQARMSRR